MNVIIYTLIMTHITSVCFSLYVHRGIAHKSIQFNPVLEHLIRFWLWLTDGTKVKEWIAMHRRHHQFADLPEDPHSPVLCTRLRDKLIFIWKNFYCSVVYRYRSFAPDYEIEFYGKGTPLDWAERNIYIPYQRLGLLLMLAINVVLFGPLGIVVWLVQVLWTPFWITIVITTCAHQVGYHNPRADDHSKNLMPWAIIIAGEELHSNHHADPKNPKFSKHWAEFDIGWLYLKVLAMLRLAKIKQ